MTDPVQPSNQRPQSTYRLQFHAGFTFDQASAISAYLRDLGVSHAYASPYLAARAGSTHGYDVIDHCRINPELGGQEGLERWIASLKSCGLSHILDIVPNHAGVGTNDNPWWNDVLEHGRASRYARAFDITWRGSPRATLHDRLLLPVLGEPYAMVLEKGELQLKFEAETGSLSVWYYDRRFPLAPSTYDRVLSSNASVWQVLLSDEDYIEYRSILAAAAHADGDTAETSSIKRRLKDLLARSEDAFRLVTQAINLFDPSGNDPDAVERLDGLLQRQHYQLAFWRVASDEINYRRFFDINDLAALRVENMRVLKETHALVLRLVDEGKVAGLRIDHPDGLYDPRQYLERLQAHRVPPLYVVVEKILASDEPLPADWPVAGTTGYDFLNKVNGLFVQSANKSYFTRRYAEQTGQRGTFADLAYEKKKLILRISLASELQMLTGLLVRLAARDRRARDFTRTVLGHCLGEMIACFPVYRTYIDDTGASQRDRAVLDAAVSAAIERNPQADATVFQFIKELLTDWLTAPRVRKLGRRFAGKFQQLTAPVTAKGVEDTAFYICNRLISLNEVGGDPDCFGVSPAELHDYFSNRQRHWPGSLSALSTHDTKRAEDARARINVLSEIPEEWFESVRQWRELNAPHQTTIDGREVPDANVEIMLYQALIGAWPLEPTDGGTFVERIKEFAQKALREAKQHTSWARPDLEYEKAVASFIERILDPQLSGDFLAKFQSLHVRTSESGMFNSLSQTLLKLTAPGVPDTYQGSELWDLSLVDPDNRRPVDFTIRQEMLTGLMQAVDSAGDDRPALLHDMLKNKSDGRIKLLTTWLSLAARNKRPDLFNSGEYVPATAQGERQDHAFGFCRRTGDDCAVIAAGRFFTGLTSVPGEQPVGSEAWGDTVLLVPGLDPAARLRDAFTGEKVSVVAGPEGPSIKLSELFAVIPVALLLTDAP